jgi:hypothetical protein
MYRCSICTKVVPPKTPCQRIISKRVHRHPFRPKAQSRWGIDKNGKRKEEWIDDPGGVGTQIVQEYPVCPDCGKGRV